MLEGLVKYFDLGLFPERPVLGSARKKARARKRLWWTLLMYIGVVLGVLGEYVLSLFGAGGKFEVSLLDPFRMVFALIIATVIFPQVFPKIFGKMELQEADDLPVEKRLLQFFIAFQNGFFWPSFIKAFVQMI